MKLDRAKALAIWMADGKYVWTAVGVNVIALVVALRPGTGEPVIRLTGLVLQLLGIASVIWGISETRALFGHASISTKVTAWFERNPLRKRAIVLRASGASISVALGSVRGYVTHAQGPNATVDARLDALEKDVTSIHDRISATDRDLGTKVERVKEALDTEVRTRSADDARIGERLEAVGTGGVHISAIGASWLFVGVVLSTAAPELEKILR